LRPEKYPMEEKTGKAQIGALWKTPTLSKRREEVGVGCLE